MLKVNDIALSKMLQPDGMLTERRVMEITKVRSPTTLRSWEKAGRFPRRIYLGPSKIVWDAAEVSEWLEQKKAEREKPAK